MIAAKRYFTRYLRDEGGAYAVVFALSAGFLFMAMHVGIDSLRVQNSGTSAEQLVDIACQKIATADPALYPTADALKAAIEKQMAARRVTDSNATDGTITIEFTGPDPKYVTPVSLTTSSATTVADQNVDLRRYRFSARYSGNVTGLHSDLAKDGKAAVKIEKPCLPVCPGFTNVIYSNGAAIGHWMDGGTSALKVAEYIDGNTQMLDGFSTVQFDGSFTNPIPANTRLVMTILSGAPNEGRIRYRRIITPSENFYIDSDSRKAPGEPSSRRLTRIVADDSDQIVIQALNADGSIPPACGETQTPPSCSGANCGGTIGGPDPCTGSCGSTAFVCSFPELPYKNNSFLNLRSLDASSSARFNLSRDGRVPGSLELRWSSGRTVNIKLAPFYVPNTDMKSVTFKGNVTKTVPAEQASALSYMSLGNRYLFIAPTPRYPNHRFLVHLAGWQLSWWWDGYESCFRFKSPIVFDTKQIGTIETTRTQKNASDPRFDYLGTGEMARVEWPVGDGQAWLVDNRDGRAASDMSGRRFFGDLDGHENGYDKLRELDTSGTGVLTGRDLDGLALWFDNGNAIVEDGELRSVVDVGVTSIDTRGEWQTLPDGREVLRSTAIMNGKPIMTEDIYIEITTPAVRLASSLRVDER